LKIVLDVSGLTHSSFPQKLTLPKDAVPQICSKKPLT